MKQFTMSMFASAEDLFEAKAEYYEKVVDEHRKVFEWVERNPCCHPENIRGEILRLLEELKGQAMSEQKDIPIGEFITIGNEIYKCVRLNDTTHGCGNCDFLGEPSCREYICFYEDRSDTCDTMFILYDNTQRN